MCVCGATCVNDEHICTFAPLSPRPLSVLSGEAKSTSKAQDTHLLQTPLTISPCNPPPHLSNYLYTIHKILGVTQEPVIHRIPRSYFTHATRLGPRDVDRLHAENALAQNHLCTMISGLPLPNHLRFSWVSKSTTLAVALRRGPRRCCCRSYSGEG